MFSFSEMPLSLKCTLGGLCLVAAAGGCYYLVRRWNKKKSKIPAKLRVVRYKNNLKQIKLLQTLKIYQRSYMQSFWRERSQRVTELRKFDVYGEKNLHFLTMIDDEIYCVTNDECGNDDTDVRRFRQFIAMGPDPWSKVTLTHVDRNTNKVRKFCVINIESEISLYENNEQLLEEAYHQKLVENKQAAEEKTAKKRAKRLKNKAKKKLKKQNVTNDPVDNSTMADEINTSESESESEVSKEQINSEDILDTSSAEKLPEDVKGCSDHCVSAQVNPSTELT